MMCAFMTPVLKNDWEVYNTQKRSRNNSETSQKCGPVISRSQSTQMRRRGLGENNRSMSYSIGNTRSDADMLTRKAHLRAYHLSTHNSRNASRASFSPIHSGVGMTNACKGEQKSTNGHRRSSSASSLTKFHNKVMDKLKNVLHLKDQDRELKNKESCSDDEGNDVFSDVRSNP